MTQTIASRTPGRTIPGPRGNLVLGSIRDIQRDNIQTFMDAWREYGDIVHFRGPLTINLVVHPDYVEHVLRHNYKNYPRPDFVADKLKTIVGDGLVGAEGDQWASSRKKAQPAFHPQIVESYASAFVETTNELLDSWDAALPVLERLADGPLLEEADTPGPDPQWQSTATARTALSTGATRRP